MAKEITIQDSLQTKYLSDQFLSSLFYKVLNLKVNAHLRQERIYLIFPIRIRLESFLHCRRH